jgi:hypothetical protein
MEIEIQLHSARWLGLHARTLGRCLRAMGAALALAAVGMAPVHAQNVPATLNSAADTERLLAEFGAWIGNPREAEELVTTLRSGRVTSTEGAASMAPATGPLGYGEARLALKLAQGALNQQGVTAPDAAQLRAALHGGALSTPQGEQTLEGVLPQKAQGTGWAAMAQQYGVSVQDILPPANLPKVKAPAKRKPAAKGKSAAKTNVKAKAKSSAKQAKPSTKTAKKPVASK